MASHRAFGEDRNRVLREVVLRIRDEDFDGNQTAAAKALGVTGATLSDFLSGKRGAGMKLLDGVAKHTRRPIEELSGGASTPPEHELAYGNAAGWREAEKEARADKDVHMPGWAFEAARTIRGIQPPNPVTKEFVISAAMHAWTAMPSEERQAREHAAMAAQVKRMVATAENRAAKKGAANEAGAAGKRKR